MKIYIVKCYEYKGDQQRRMVWYCIYDWRRLNNADNTYYEEIMNMVFFRYNDEHQCSVAITYHQEPNKW